MSESPLQIRVTTSGSQRTYRAKWSTKPKSPFSSFLWGLISLVLGIVFLFFVFWAAVLLFALGAVFVLIGWLRMKWRQRKHSSSEEFEHSFDQEVIEDAVVVEETKDS